AVGGGAEPEVPVDALADGFGGEVALDAGGAGVDGDRLEFADAAGADHLAGETELAAGALLGADLEDAGVAVDGVDQVTRFADREGEGFLAVDVLAGGAGGGGDEGVPVVGGGDEDGVDVGAGEEIAKV